MTMQTQERAMTTYRFQVQGTVSTSQWHLDRHFENDGSACNAASDLAKEFVGMRGFMALGVFRLHDSGDLSAAVYLGSAKLSEVEATFTVPKAR